MCHHVSLADSHAGPAAALGARALLLGRALALEVGLQAQPQKQAGEGGSRVVQRRKGFLQGTASPRQVAPWGCALAP